MASSPRRRCTKCNVPKSIDQFARRYNKRRASCKQCHNDYLRNIHYVKNKEAYYARSARRRKKMVKIVKKTIFEYLSSHSCVDCGESNPLVLEFDHVRGKKHADVASISRGDHSMVTVFREIEKCDVRCANCHRIRTMKSRGWMRAKF